MAKTSLNRAYVEIGNVCNLACSFCPGTTREARRMTEAEFCCVAEKLRPHTEYLYLHVMGEPLFHPTLDRFLLIASEYGFRVCITTNGTLLGTRGNVLLSHAETIHKVSISLHSMEGNDVVSAVEGELDGRTEAYLHSAVDFAYEASARGIYTVFRLWNLDSAEHKGSHRENDAILSYLHTAFPDEWKERHDGMRLMKNVFLEYAEIFTWPTESEAEEQESGFCHGLCDQIAVLADGTVVPCCLDSEGEIALGNLYDSTLDAILASDRATAMREGFRNRKLVEPLCRTCTYARRFR